MKKTILLFIIIIFGLGIIFLKNNNDKDNLSNENHSIKDIIVSTDNHCEFDKTFYTEEKNNKFYTACLTKIEIKLSDDNIFELNEALNNNHINLNDLISVSDKKTTLESSNLYQIDNLSFLVCENNEVIFGDYQSLEKNNYCEVGVDESV